MSKQAIEWTRLNAFGVDPDALTIIGLDTEDGPAHPCYDPRVKLPINEGLVSTMIALGFFGSVTVQKVDGRTLVVAGRQRVRAAREANKRLLEAGKEPIQVTCMVRRGDGSDLVAVAENELRTDDDAITRANKASALLNRGRTEEEVCVAFGLSLGGLRSLLSLGEAHPAVKKAVTDGAINVSAAYTIVKLKLEEQEAALAELVASGVGTRAGRAAEKLVRQTRAKARGQETYDPPSKRQLKEVLKHHEEFVIDPSAIAVIRWVLGQGSPSKITGLSGMLRQLEEHAAKKKAKHT